MGGSYRLLRIFGIDILVHWSWLAIFVLLTWWLSQGFFDDQFEDWTGRERWAAALIASLAFFTSILLHELAHSLVAKREGLPVKSITLFIFGGVSALGAEPENPGQEFRVAIVGPLVSFLLAGAFGVAALVAHLSGVGDRPPAAVVFYLAIINAALGVFNMLPGYPLDGGRVLRAGLWARGRNLLTATRRASLVGSFLAFGLIALGVVFILAESYIQGTWFIVIGWFLRTVSESSYQQLLHRSTLEGTKVGQLINRSFNAAPPDMYLSILVEEYMLAGSQRSVPIVAGDELLGLVTMQDLKRVPKEAWATTSVFRAMTPREKLHQVEIQDDISKALETMAKENINQLPVIEFGRFVGFVTRADVLRLMQVRSELGGVGSASNS
ncbi:MAG: site-2 protease family protein [Chloroflexi bacterium]|nr:site-2 protease family protein [Chloroflexota bacterium]